MSFKLKTILLFLGVSLIPYILTMVLLGSSYYQEQHTAITQEMNTQLHLTVERMDQSLKTLQKDMAFIANSDVMNDMYTHDLDRRIANTLLAKKNDMKLVGNFFVFDPKGVVIASSDFGTIGKKVEISPFAEVPIVSNFTRQVIGRLAVDYRVENFKRFFHNTEERQYFLRYGEGREELRVRHFPESLEVVSPLPSKPALNVVLEEEKEFAFRLLYKYERLFVILLVLGGGFIALAAYYVATGLIRPVIILSEAAKQVTKTQDYTRRVSIDREDEIGQLSDAFNTMIGGMGHALGEITALNTEIEDTQREVVFTMGSIGESRSKETGNHVRRVAEYSKLLALYYGLKEEEAEMLRQASPMHDIGKVAIPDAVLNKPGRFDEEERRIMDTHAALGYDMLKHSQRPLLLMAATVAYEHHEKYDGSGYPRGLSGEDIHIYGRITALADVFDALGSDRVYKQAWDDERIFNLFREERGKHFDPKLIDIFFDHLDEFLAIRDHLKDTIEN
ncbi:MAG: HD domain-containing protein [Sulfuricurvum sp.]|jgi:response regulator RpfG family c-di-GMP phosphodiesterase|uniref:HD domain-containing phosphohydrolase n=1 Tax=Sulfuricurvum sp. TaxID=2025608 RepID=UPI0025CDC450|nr:HD domain-containing phosphohydrolase [Sulfuricurvum sp.]MCK9374419.1 HD domain-containing protein [Sulfuricurvum sp.]